MTSQLVNTKTVELSSATDSDWPSTGENDVEFENKKHVDCSEQTEKKYFNDSSHQQFFRCSKLSICKI